MYWIGVKGDYFAGKCLWDCLAKCNWIGQESTGNWTGINACDTVTMHTSLCFTG